MPFKSNSCIFVVDDDVIFRNLYTHILKKLGYNNIHLFDNGNDCFMQLEETPPNIVFLDYNMDELDGIDVLKQLKKFDPSITVVIISGQDDIETAVKTLRLGAFDYVTKSSVNVARIKILIERIENQSQPIKTELLKEESLLKRLLEKWKLKIY